MVGIVSRSQDFDQEPEGLYAVKERGPDRSEELAVGVMDPAGQRHIVEFNQRAAFYGDGADPKC
jgi:hypothetical protein